MCPAQCRESLDKRASGNSADDRTSAGCSTYMHSPTTLRWKTETSTQTVLGFFQAPASQRLRAESPKQTPENFWQQIWFSMPTLATQSFRTVPDCNHPLAGAWLLFDSDRTFPAIRTMEENQIEVIRQSALSIQKSLMKTHEWFTQKLTTQTSKLFALMLPDKTPFLEERRFSLRHVSAKLRSASNVRTSKVKFDPITQISPRLPVLFRLESHKP